MARDEARLNSTLNANSQTIRDVVSPWAGMGPLPAPSSSASVSDDDDDDDDGAPTLRRLPISAYASFGTRVHAAVLPLLASFVGDVASSWIDQEYAESGEPRDLVSALAIGHALVTRIPDARSRETARNALDSVLREVKMNSLMPPPVSSTTRPPRSADLDRCRRDR